MPNRATSVQLYEEAGFLCSITSPFYDKRADSATWGNEENHVTWWTVPKSETECLPDVLSMIHKH
jgi:hypothetical protein